MTVVIVAGPRKVKDYDLVRRAIEKSGLEITEIVSGRAPGVDSHGERYARDNDIPIKMFPADWNKHKKGAGFIRNTEMANYAKENGGSLLVLWDKKSKGTKHMIKEARRVGIPIKLYIIKLPEDRKSGV